jgi:replicative DNA helicase
VNPVRSNRTPIWSDLLVRPEIYEEDEDARAEKAGEAELIIAKQRNGPVGEIALTFLKEFTRFEDRARNVIGTSELSCS